MPIKKKRSHQGIHKYKKKYFGAGRRVAFAEKSEKTTAEMSRERRKRYWEHTRKMWAPSAAGSYLHYWCR